MDKLQCGEKPLYIVYQLTNCNIRGEVVHTSTVWCIQTVTPGCLTEHISPRTPLGGSTAPTVALCGLKLKQQMNGEILQFCMIYELAQWNVVK